MATAFRNTILSCVCHQPDQKINEDCEVICNKCYGRVSIEKAKWCFCDDGDFRTITVAPEGLYITCTECRSFQFYANPEDVSKPLPEICRCGKVELYETIQGTGRTLVLCRECCIMGEVKLSKDHSCYELWTTNQCPSCQADAIRFSSVDPRSNAYICDDCDISFKIDRKDQKDFETVFGQPSFLWQITDIQSLREGDLILLGDKCSENLYLVMDITEFCIFIVGNKLNQDFISLSSLPSPIYRVEYLPHDRYSSVDAVFEARTALQQRDTKNSADFLKAGREIKSEYLQTLPVKGAVAVFEGCEHCREPLCRSCLHEFRDDEIVLYCTACEKQYTVPDTRDVRAKLSSGNYGEECGVERIEDISQLGNGDLISFKHFGYSHHALCLEVDKKSGKVVVVDFNFDKVAFAPRILERSLSFEKDILHCNVRVLRFMPLDCLPIDRVMKRALKLALNPSLQESYSAFRNNCQHVASWCKTDQMKSKEGSFYRKVYGYASVAVNLLSFFVPGVRWVCRGFIVMESVFKGMNTLFEPPKPTENYDGMSLPPVAKEPNALNSAAGLARAGLKTAFFFL